MLEFMFHISIFDSLYNKEFIKYMRSLDGEFLLDNRCIYGPESFPMYYDS